jgi:Nucleoside 2-deoxyribosyltransferase like
MSLTVITAPEYVGLNPRKISLFFGGSIELGASRDWQAELINTLKNKPYSQYLEVLNPRRAAWDSSWPIDDPTHPELKDQINWELYYQDKVDILIYNFATGTVAPITLLELGTYAPRNPVINIEDGYKRHANVKITADHFGWEYCEDWDSFIKAIDQRVQLQLDFRHNIIMK